jgi:DNA-binding NarL/FixJ family response regulator
MGSILSIFGKIQDYFKPKKINFFIIEDENLFSSMLSHTVSELYDSDIKVFNSLEIVLSQTLIKPDVILLDHFLNGVNGIDALPIIQKNYPKAHVIIISGQQDTNLISTVNNMTNCHYLQKQNFSIHNLHEKIKTTQIHY